MGQALVLVGGLGTRLHSVVKDRPKPMSPVGDRPFLAYVLDLLVKHGFLDVVLCTGHLGEMVEEHFGDGRGLGLHLRYSREPEPLGTAGAVRFAADLVSGDEFLLLNGDSLFAVDLRLLMDDHRRAGALATLALRPMEDGGRFGAVDLAKDGSITGFREKDPARRNVLINGGVYAFRRELLEKIPEGRAVSLEREVFPDLLGPRFRGVVSDGYFVDMGLPEIYMRLNDDPTPLAAAVT